MCYIIKRIILPNSYRICSQIYHASTCESKIRSWFQLRDKEVFSLPNPGASTRVARLDPPKSKSEEQTPALLSRRAEGLTLRTPSLI